MYLSMAPQTDAKQLLDLLKRAAEELKASQRDTSSARAEVKKLEEKLAEAQVALSEERRRVMSDFTGKTAALPDAARPRDEKTSVGADDVNLLGARVQGLQDEIQQLEAERKQLKERVKALEGELQNVDATRQQGGEMEHELSNTRQQLIVEQARGADLLTRLQAWEVRSQELETSLASSRTAGEEEHAQLEGLAGQLSQVETELTTERARTQAMEEQLKNLEQGSTNEQKRLFEATTRVAQLEVEVSGLRGRRDELNIEIGKVENERNAARAKAAELEHAAQQVRDQLGAEHAAANEASRVKYTELEQQLSKEKEKLQITAQKLLEARGQGKQLDEQLQTQTKQNVELVARMERERAAHAAATEAARVAQVEATAQLTSQVAQLTAQLETATTEWRHTDRQYEQLHKEMLTILDQRDEARRELDSIKQKFGLR